MPVGPSRHLVRFLVSSGILYALKELPLGVARQEYDVLLHLENLGLPTVEGSPPPETVVCVLTGHGLKDPDTALSKAPAVLNCENDLSAVERAVFD